MDNNCVKYYLRIYGSNIDFGCVITMTLTLDIWQESKLTFPTYWPSGPVLYNV